ncbi:MAG TPA: hypothetical protein DCG04_07005 [Rhodospirillaceae bacterium]|nr:hypothetical protein [Rhodospirillaceae bacterium]MAX62715.1 hypothetical protein [Rhodospirillaceae bacterium]MBB57506.1 hypothetical protein [Rhodospirillaceae bacterium]HAE01202.1 hypothetical protein [Rhodospirillaceae bacterium]HBM14402.1 hypothetical protein [Rhodospirillaceae bacterium]
MFGFPDGFWLLEYVSTFCGTQDCVTKSKRVGGTVADKTPFQQEVAELIVTALHLEDVAADDIGLDDPLFGDGLGLDSVDALELSLEISERYNCMIRSDDPDIDVLFGSLRSLTAAIETRRGE